MVLNSLHDILRMITPEVYANIKRAVEIGKWNDGSALDSSQRELCMQALIAYETEHLPKEERSGYVHKAQCASTATENIKFVE